MWHPEYRLVAALMLLVGACGDEIGAATEVRPFDEVQASEFSFESDPSNPNRGIFKVTTTESMICAIVWGEDENLGNFANSLDMAGTGIVQHDVFLPGVTPGVEYQFIVQGTTADGTLYRSELGSFTIPESEEVATPADARPNLAVGAVVVEVSSEFGDAYAAERAVDGDLSTEWSSAGDGDRASITLDLGEPVEVSGLAFLTRSMADGTAITDSFTVTVDEAESLGPYQAGSPADPRPAEVAVNGQFFTFDVDSSSGGNTGAVEIRILGG